MFDYVMHNRRWCIVFLQADGRMNLEETQDLLLEATLMYLSKDEEHQVEGKNYEGVLYTKGNHEMFGCYSGQRYDAELERDDGKLHIKFLIADTDNASMN